jgi:hypothetical protein
MKIRLRIDAPYLRAEHARSLRTHLVRDGWETELEYDADTVTVLLPEEGGAARLAWSVVEWRDERPRSPEVVPETFNGAPVPEELVRILGHVPPPPGVTLRRPDDRESMPAVPDSDGRIAGDGYVGPPGPVLDPGDDWDRD